MTAFGAGLDAASGGAGFAVAAGAGARDFVESGAPGFGGVTAAGGAAGAGAVGAVASDCAPGCRTGMKRTESPTAMPAVPAPRDTRLQRAWRSPSEDTSSSATGTPWRTTSKRVQRRTPSALPASIDTTVAWT